MLPGFHSSGDIITSPLQSLMLEQFLSKHKENVFKIYYIHDLNEKWMSVLGRS